jgi:hypothetical protein
VLSGSKAFLTSEWVKDVITFNKYAGARPYRFVFLDGCNTANGDWPDAFGVTKTNYFDTTWYTSTNNTRHMRPSAFVGWTATVGGQGWGSVTHRWEFNTYWIANWAVDIYGDGLSQAINNAMTGASWPPDDKKQLLKKFGYLSIKFNQFNHKADWQWP